MLNDYKSKIVSLNLKSKPIFDVNDHFKYTNDWRGQYNGDAIAVLKPQDKEEISKIFKYNTTLDFCIVPHFFNIRNFLLVL